MLEQEKEFQDLLQGINNRSEEAVRRFIDSYGPVLLRIIRRRLVPKLRKQFDSDDFLQDVYASFLCKPQEPECFADAEALFAYLTRMAANKVIDAMRYRGRQKCDYKREFSLEGSAHVQAGGLPVPDPTPSAWVGAREQFEGLPAIEQKIIDLIQSGLSAQEIAESMKLHPKWVQRILRKLRAKV